MRSRPLRRRVVLGMVALCASVLLVTCLAIYAGTQRALLVNLDMMLWTIGETEVASALDGPMGTVHLHMGEPVPIRFSPHEGYEKIGEIQDADGRVLARTPGARVQTLNADPVARAKAIGGAVSWNDLRRNGQVMRAVYFPMRDAAGLPLVAIVALSREPMENVLTTLRIVLALGWLMGVVGSYAGAVLVTRRLVAPLERMAEAASPLREGARLPEDQPDTELVTLARTINGMIGRLEATLEVRSQLLASQKRFMADASHELRTPLNNMRGTVEVALRRPRGAEEYREALEVCLHEVERMSRLVSELLDLERAEGGQLVVQHEPVDASSLADETVRAWRARAGARQVRLTRQGNGPAWVSGDAGRLRQALDNLLDNAVRYSPAGAEVAVLVGAVQGQVEIRVSDRGVGLSDEASSQVFERFYREDPSRDRSSGGLGLGLAITRAILEAHGGTVSVESRPGDGSTFVLRLPLLAAAREVEAPRA